MSELHDYQFQALEKKLDEILVQVTKTNGRMDRAEDDIIRLQERTSPAAASTLTGTGLAILYGLVEWLKR